MKDIHKLFEQKTKRNKFPNVLGRINDFVTVNLYSPINREIRTMIFYSTGGVYYMIAKNKIDTSIKASTLKALHD